MNKKFLSLSIILISIIFISAVVNHSVQEIHYLKSFFPDTFSVEQAMYASIIELVKVILIAIPLTIIIFISLHFLKKK